jgi:hypothetical protein
MILWFFATGFFKDLLYRGPDFIAKKTPIFFLFAKILKEVSVSDTALILFQVRLTLSVIFNCVRAVHVCSICFFNSVSLKETESI